MEENKGKPFAMKWSNAWCTDLSIKVGGVEIGPGMAITGIFLRITARQIPMLTIQAELAGDTTIEGLAEIGLEVVELGEE